MPARGAQGPDPVADYQFQDSLESAVEGAPNLTTHGRTRFAEEDVDGEDRTVLEFPSGAGLAVVTDELIADGDEYTVVILFRFDNVEMFHRILDVRGGTSDTGLYVFQGNLDYYDAAPGSGEPIEADAWAQVALTHDADGVVVGYVDGEEQFSVQDPNGFASLEGSDLLRFFVDDNEFPGETSAGAVARIRIYDRPLSADEIESLDRLPGQGEARRGLRSGT